MYKATGLSLAVVAIAVTTFLIIGENSSVSGQTAGQKESFSAAAVNTSNVGRTGIERVLIDITRWTSDSESQTLLRTLSEKGPDALLSALRKQRSVGTIRTPDSLAYDLRYARQGPHGDGDRQIVITTDRYVTFWERTSGARSLDYPFTVIELHIKPNGTGEGKLSIATKVVAKGNTIELENYAYQPVLLQNVTSVKK